MCWRSAHAFQNNPCGSDALTHCVCNVFVGVAGPDHPHFWFQCRQICRHVQLSARYWVRICVRGTIACVHKCVHGMACTHLPVFTPAHTHSAQVMATTRPSVYISFPLRIKYPVSRHTCIRMYIHANQHHSHTHLRKNILAHVDTHHASVLCMPPSC